MPAELLSGDLAEAVQQLRDRDEAFAFATIVRTAGTTAAKPGAKALLSADGSIVGGFLGGGCTQNAVKRAALEALKSGEPQLISIAPEDFLSEKGVSAGDEVDGVTFSRNGCPSRGTVDIFVEPCLPMPELMIWGASPVAEALAKIAPQFHWSVNACGTSFDGASPLPKRNRVIVIATQGQGDLNALRFALSVPSVHVAFVGSRKKFASLSKKLLASGATQDALESVKAPAGLDIGAVTPEEIALSILAELIKVRRISLGQVRHG